MTILENRLGILILNFNEPEMTYGCFESIRTQIPNVNAEFLIVDNGSSEEKFSQLLDLIKPGNGYSLSVLRIKENAGPGPAISAGLQKLAANSDYIVMSHNDTEVLSGTISLLLDSIATNTEFVAIGCVQENFSEPHTVMYVGGEFRMPGFIPSHGTDLKPNVNLIEVDWLDFTSLIFNSRHLSSVGFPNPIFDFYWEDVEWSIRAKKNGFRLGVSQKAVVRHRFGATLGTGKNFRFFNYVIKHHFLTIKLHGSKIDSVFAIIFWVLKSFHFLLRIEPKPAYWIFCALRKAHKSV